METVYRDYAPKGIQFYYLYKALAHPEYEGYVRPVTLEERLMHIKEAKRTLGTEIPWICDTMSNDLKHAIGDAPNSEYVLDPDGKIAAMRMWSKPEELRKDLERLVGPVERPTTVADLNMRVAPPPKTAPTEIVPRLPRTEPARPLKVEPQTAKSKHPFYVKLRAEANRQFLEQGRGKVYLAFRLDPIYGVHWNNLVAPVEYEFFPPEGVRISPAKGSGPQPKEEADADPREFLIEADRGGSTEPVRMTFRYFACDEKMCMPVKQEYLIRWEVDPDAGWTIRRPARPAAGQAPPSPERMAERLMQRDANGDGKLSREEFPEPLRQRFERMDADGDGSVTAAEAKAFAASARPAPRRGP